MTLLDEAVETVRSWGADRMEDRERCLSLFKQTVERMDQGIAVWERFQKEAPESGDRFTTVLWMGPVLAKELHAHYLANRDTAIALTALTGVRFKDSLSLNEELDILQPYDQLGPNESGRDRAASAIRVMVARKERVEAAIAGLTG